MQVRAFERYIPFLILPLWEAVIVVCFVVRYTVSILVLHHLDGKERAGCFA